MAAAPETKGVAIEVPAVDRDRVAKCIHFLQTSLLLIFKCHIMFNILDKMNNSAFTLSQQSWCYLTSRDTTTCPTEKLCSRICALTFIVVAVVGLHLLLVMACSYVRTSNGTAQQDQQESGVSKHKC